MGERGSVLPLVVVLVAVAIGVVLVLSVLFERAMARAQAQTAADFAALAAVHEGESAAAELAARNGGRLVAFSERDGRVRVVVAVGPAQAVAAAEFGWDVIPIDGP